MRLGESMPEVIAVGKEEEGGATAAGAGAWTSVGGAAPPMREPKERGAVGGFRSLVAGLGPPVASAAGWPGSRFPGEEGVPWS